MIFGRKNRETAQNSAEDNSSEANAADILSSAPSFEEHMRQMSAENSSEDDEKNAAIDKVLEDINNNLNSFEVYNIAFEGVKSALAEGADPNELASRLPSWTLGMNAPQLKEAGANIDMKKIAKEADPSEVLGFLDGYMEQGANLDVNKLVDRLSNSLIGNKFATLAGYGADTDRLVRVMSPTDIANEDVLKLLDAYHIDIDCNEIASEICSRDIWDPSKHLIALKKHGVAVEDMIGQISNAGTLSRLVEKWQDLEDAGIALNYEQCAEKLKDSPMDLLGCIDALVEKGVNVDMDALKDGLGGDADAKASKLRKYGANIEVDEGLLARIQKRGGEAVLDNMDLFEENNIPVDIEQILDGMRWDGVARHVDELLKYGADAEKVVAKMGTLSALGHLDALERSGVDIERLVDSALETKGNAVPSAVEENLPSLLEHGVPVEKLMSAMPKSYIVKHLSELNAAGANIDVNSIVESCPQETVVRNIDTLLDQGCDALLIAKKMGARNIAAFLDKLSKHADISSLALILQEKMAQQSRAD